LEIFICISRDKTPFANWNVVPGEVSSLEMFNNHCGTYANAMLRCYWMPKGQLFLVHCCGNIEKMYYNVNAGMSMAGAAGVV